MNATPVWLLDVDGVLNASRAGWSAAPRTVAVWALGERWRLRFSPQLVARIRQLHETGTVEIRWATSWVGNTGAVATALGLPSFPDAFVFEGDRPPHDRVVTQAKITAALDVVEGERRRLIWTDDWAIPVPDAPARVALEAAGALLICPQSSKGLRPEHLDRIETFIDTHAPV